MWSKKQFTPAEVAKLCQDALDNWDATEMSADEIRTLQHYAATPAANTGIEVTEALARSFNNEWDWVAELATATDWTQ